MTLQHLPSELDPNRAATFLSRLGFLSDSDLPDRPGPAYLLVALRARPTHQHFDPELVRYWTTDHGRGRPATLTHTSHVPVEQDVSWGLIEIVDRLHVSNEYLTFGGRLSAANVDGTVVAVFTSPAPILRRGGHSQGWDHGAERLGAFFGRLLPAVDYVAGFEGRLANATPLARYAAFVADVVTRYRHQPRLRGAHPELWMLLEADNRRLRTEHPNDWAAGQDILGCLDGFGVDRRPGSTAEPVRKT